MGAEIFLTRPCRLWGPPSLLYNWYRISFSGVKRPGRGIHHLPTSNAEVKERCTVFFIRYLYYNTECCCKFRSTRDNHQGIIIKYRRIKPSYFLHTNSIWGVRNGVCDEYRLLCDGLHITVQKTQSSLLYESVSGVCVSTISYSVRSFDKVS